MKTLQVIQYSCIEKVYMSVEQMKSTKYKGKYFFLKYAGAYQLSSELNYIITSYRHTKQSSLTDTQNREENVFSSPAHASPR